jgi:DNA-binding GntR family transcriptional regulator
VINMSDLVDVVDPGVIYSECDPRSTHMSIPLYEQLAEQLREEIRAGRLKPGDRLPSQTALKEQGWSHYAILSAMRELKSGGWTRGQSGRAVYVADHPPIE